MPEVDEVPISFVAIHLYMPASFARQSRISSRTVPKSMEGRNFVPLGNGLPFTCHSVIKYYFEADLAPLTYLHGGVVGRIQPGLEHRRALLSHGKVIEMLSESWIPESWRNFLLRINAWRFQVLDLVKCGWVQRTALEPATN